MPSKCYLGQNYKYRHQNYSMHKLLQWELKCWTLLRWSARGMLWGWCFLEKFGKFSRLDVISSYISINWSKFPGDSGKGGSLVMRCEVRSLSFMYKELRTVFLILPFWSEEILFSLQAFFFSLHLLSGFLFPVKWRWPQFDKSESVSRSAVGSACWWNCRKRPGLEVTSGGL